MVRTSSYSSHTPPSVVITMQDDIVATRRQHDSRDGQDWEHYKHATPGLPVMLEDDRSDADGTSVVCHSTSVGH